MSDRPTILDDLPGAASLGIVTPAMIAAAIRVIADDYGICSELVAEGLVHDVFKAMISSRPNQTAGYAKEPPGIT
jgi:hypothetical protein